MASGILLLRLTIGLTLAAHGAQKLFGWFGRRQPNGGRSRPTVDLPRCDDGVDCDTGGTERRR